MAVKINTAEIEVHFSNLFISNDVHHVTNKLQFADTQMYQA